MCSICGGNYPLEVIQKASESMRHRGKDFSGSFCDNVVSLAHNRLSIIDLNSEANQPFTSPYCPHLVLVFNGEIYNYKELAKKYHLKTQTRSDTEVLLLLFDKLGTSCLKELNGMFAFGIYDAKKKQIFLARDRYGKKPLYFSKMAKNFAFASEIKALKTIFTPTLQQDSIVEYLHSLAPCRNHTFFNEIKKLQAGYFLRYDIPSQNLQIACYYDLASHCLSSQFLEKGQAVKSIDEAKQKTFDLLQSSLELRLVSDVPIASFLSGGLDSSLVSALYAARGKIDTFSIGYDEYKERYCELKYAKLMADFIGSNHHEIVMNQRDFLQSFDEMMRLWDEPINDPAIVPTYILSSQAHQNGFKVALSGEGSDELFFGYDAVLRFLQYAKKFAKYAKEPLFVQMCQNAFSDNFEARRIQRIFKGENLAYRGINESWSKKELEDLYRRKVCVECFNGLWKQFSKKKNIALWCSYVDFKHWIAEVLMTKIDRASMLHTLEVRNPFLDYRLVDFVMGLKKRFKIDYEQSKFLLKEIIKDKKLLPNEIVNRNKKGFSTPYFEWYFGEYGNKILQDYLKMNKVLGCFDEKYLTYLFKKGQTGEMKSQNWSMIVLSKWLETHS